MEPLTEADPTTIGKYVLHARLGSGGMGVVYLGSSPTGDFVALKVIRPDKADAPQFLKRFDSEIDVLRRVYGQRVARFEDAGTDLGKPWLAVEFVRGHSLGHYVEHHGPLEPRLVAILGAMLAEGLQRVHAEGLLHRDLKPQNVLLGPEGPKVIDFGLAALVGRDRQLTETGGVVGTYAYMSPEQSCGQPLTVAADVYSLGATLFYAATGKRLYGTLPLAQLLARLTDADVSPDLGGLAESLRSLIVAMIAHKQSERPTLGEVTGWLLSVAIADGRSVAEVREELVRLTSADTGEFDMPENNPSLDEDEEYSLSVQSTSKQPVAAAALVDLGWLVERIRSSYDRKPTL